MRKKLLIFFFAITLVCCNVYAHSGRTDFNGGHMNHSTGEYHYHHGYPEHQHPNGICPYDDRYSNYATIEKDKEDDYDYENEVVEVVQEDEKESDSIIWMIVEIIGIIAIARWIRDIVKKKRE